MNSVSGANSLTTGAVARLRSSLSTSPMPPRYELVDVLGEGGMGIVWRAHDRVLGRDVAVKVLAAHLGGDALMSRLAREARILATLEHPGIVPVFDMGAADDGTPWYAMRLVEGVPLDVAAREQDPPRDRRALFRVVEQLCETLAYAHAHGVAHRDLTPRNVMLGPFGEVLVLDWGVAQEAALDSAPDFGAGTVVGTPGFMAPEQAAGRPGDARSDIYGLGAILRELSTVHDEPTPRALRSIIARACADDPDARYASPLELRDDLRRFEAGDRVLAHRETALEAVARFVNAYRTPILLVLAYLVMRIAILWWRGV